MVTFASLEKQVTNGEIVMGSIIHVAGWVRTIRESSSILGFCNINDGSNVNGLQLIISDEHMNEDEIKCFFSKVNTGMYLNVDGNIIESPAAGQKFEVQVKNFVVEGHLTADYPLCKSKMSLDMLRNHIHLRSRTNTFGSVFRLRSKVMKFLHDFYHKEDFHHLDPNIITINECEGGAGVFQLTEHNLSNYGAMPYKNNVYEWSKDHFNSPAYLTVSSQLQLEAMACSMGNVYTMNKSFRSEHSSTSKHVSEFTHLEIEMVNNNFDELMDHSEKMIYYILHRVFEECNEEIENLNKFVSRGLKERLTHLKNSTMKRVRYIDILKEINNDIAELGLKLDLLYDGDDLGSAHENYITEKYNCPVFVTHWPLKIKSFYMKQCDDGTCESFDLLMPYGIGELIGASQREENYEKLVEIMKEKGVDVNSMSFYLDLRKYGTCKHGGFGMGFDRLLMLITGMQNIKDVIPFPVFYKSCKY